MFLLKWLVHFFWLERTMQGIILRSLKTSLQESLAHQVLVGINLTSSTNPLRGWKTYLPLGGCLTFQLQKMRESTSRPWAYLPFPYKAFLQTLLNKSACFFKFSFKLLQPTVTMSESCVGGHGNHLCASWHGVFSWLFWVHEAAEDRLEPYVWRSAEVSEWGPP